MNNGNTPANPTTIDNGDPTQPRRCMGLTKREHFASIAPYQEIDSIIGDTIKSAAAFLDITIEDYAKDQTMNYIRCCMLCRRMWADALLKELDKHE